MVAYDYLPSDYKVTNDQTILTKWDNLETKILNVYSNTYEHYIDEGSEIIMVSPLTLTRLLDASNDRMLAVKITFGWNFYRYCPTT